ncbi:MAG TPA: HAMP domain-containing sensor histidine kinase [Gammaproteobacteria bacterium]|nr:HAMP domain-containing sensor histidine kinase [Gammaproteobacteria bacterium]
MIPLLGRSPLFRKIMISILFASTGFMSLLTIVIYYSNDTLENDLLDRQTDFELEHIRKLLKLDPEAPLPSSASLSVYLDSRREKLPIPDYLTGLEVGVQHDLKLGGKAYHVLVSPQGNDRIYIRYDVTEIEHFEDLLQVILVAASVVLLIVIFFIARILSSRLSGPIEELSETLSHIDPDQRGVRLGEHFADDEVGRIAQAFDTYTEKMDDYVEKQMAFAAMASHELRSPLTIVQTSADLIASRSADRDILPHLEKIQRATVGMANMIHALLAVTRDKPVSQARQTVFLRPLATEIIESLQPEIHAKRIEIDNRLSAEAAVKADPTLLTVVLTNLIRNAVKHGDRSSILIEMRDGELSIADSGIGIDPESLKRIFDFGFRGQQSQGYGIGLYISRLVCEYQDWSLELEPNPGGGIVARVGFGA